MARTLKNKPAGQRMPSPANPTPLGASTRKRAAGKRADRRVTPEELSLLRESLREAQETLDAIRGGEVDAVVVNGVNGSKIYSLASAEQPYRIFVERMQEGAVSVSSDGTILYSNQCFADMLGLPLEQVIASKLPARFRNDAWNELMQGLHDGAERVTHEAVLLRQPEGTLAVKLAASSVPMEDQKIVCLVVTDLTKQKQHAEMRLAKELAEKASLAKDSFLAALSHELRTPLNPALMAAVALEKDKTLPAAVSREVSMIRRNVELEARLIDDLLDLTRIAQGKLELHNDWMEIHSAILRALEICQPDTEAKQQHLILHLDATCTETTGDVVRIQQVVWNLIRNASKFTPLGGTISISTGNAESNRVWVKVADSGIGFTPETKPMMFIAFEQGGRHITRQFGGLGLGLAISRSIVEAHGGTITAESEGRDRGATFTVELPLRSVNSNPPLPDETPAVAVPPDGGFRILLVEDHRDTRLSMEILLRRAKHQVWSAESAREALALAEKQPFDLVITDLGLPDESGLGLMRKLRDRYGLKGIATSGYGMEEDIARGREVGFVHHLTKPISTERLGQILAGLRVAKAGAGA